MRILPVLLLAAVAAPGDAFAQLVVSANENKVTLIDGVVTTVRNAPPDTVTIIDLNVSPPRIIAEIPVPASIIGPPESVAIAPDGSIALVTAATKLDPADPTTTIPDDRVTIIDLKASPPAVAATVRAGRGASGVSFNPAGTLALVANRIDGTLSAFTVKGKTLEAAGTIDLGAPDSGPCHVAFTRDGRTALVTRNNDSLISLLSVEGSKVSYAKRDIAAGLKPYPIDVSRTADLAVVGHTGAGPTGGADTIGLIDLTRTPPRTIDHATVGPTAEGLAISPDGKYVAVTVMDNSNQPKSSPLFNPNGRLRVFSVSKTALALVTEAPIGSWCQGVGWSRDSRTVLAQCAAQKEIYVFRFDGKQLTRSPSIKVNGGPSGLAVGR